MNKKSGDTTVTVTWDEMRQVGDKDRLAQCNQRKRRRGGTEYK